MILTRHFLVGDDIHAESKQFDSYAAAFLLMQQFILDEATTKIIIDIKE